MEIILLNASIESNYLIKLKKLPSTGNLDKSAIHKLKSNQDKPNYTLKKYLNTLDVKSELFQLNLRYLRARAMLLVMFRKA